LKIEDDFKFEVKLKKTSPVAKISAIVLMRMKSDGWAREVSLRGKAQYYG
jgi:hypothetical protein